MAELDILRYRWAAVKAARTAFKQFGWGTSLECADAEGAALLALMECPRTFDPTRWGGGGTSLCDGTFGNYVKRAAYNCVKRLCDNDRKLAAGEMAEEQEADELAEEDRAQRLRQWARGNAERQAALAELANEPEKLSKRTAEVLAELRTEFAVQRERGRMLTVIQAAKALRRADRRVRALCQHGALPAYREDGEWMIPAAEVSKFRRDQIVLALSEGATYRAAAKVGRCSLDTVCRNAAKGQRARGRPPRHDHDLVRSMLTDPIAHPGAWKWGRPCLSVIARIAGCSRMVVHRIAGHAGRGESRRVPRAS